MAIKKVWIEEGCISDGICEEICPDVFAMDDDDMAYVKPDADFSSNEDCIKESAEECPAEVIKYEEE